jgi:RimJ/RimL family protein N-acetyltransferase
MTIPTLHTDRLTLRAPENADFRPFAAFHAGPRAAAAQMTLDEPSAFQRFLSLAGSWQVLGYGGWIVTENGRPAGHVRLHNVPHKADIELAWTLFDGFEGRGLAQEAALAARRFAFDTLGLSRLVSYVLNDNTRSAALARRLGCTPEGAPAHNSNSTTWLHPKEAA